MRYYAGIGSRETPTEILHLMNRIAWKLNSNDLCGINGELIGPYILRSGGAIGADTAFEDGSSGDCEIFKAHHATPMARYIASEFHSAWGNLSDYVQNLHGRNAMILLGKNLDTPVDFVVCWTKDGKDTGGTGLGIRIAQAHGIKVINLFYPEWRERIKKFINEV